MKGKLTDQSLAELISEIASKHLTGTLRLERERMQTAVYFEQGQIVFAAANLRTLRLREYLTRSGLLSTAEVDQLANDLPDLALAASLTASGRLSTKELDGLLECLVSDTLRVALLLTDGNWEFDQRARLEDPVQVKIDIATLLREAARRMPPEFVARRFRNPAETFSRTTGVSDAAKLLGPEAFLLSRLDQPTSLTELVALSGLPDLDAYQVIYGLTLSGLVTREHWQNAFRTEAAKPARQPGQPPVAKAAAEATVDNPWASVSDEEEVLEKFLRRLRQATNYYEVIELPPTSQANEIKEAYYALARSYHPDRFHVRSGTPLHSELSSAFARITQAYETLTDANARAAYDRTLARSRFLAESAPKPEPAVIDQAAEVDLAADAPEKESERAENNFSEGRTALQQGRLTAAVTHLAAAARVAPQEARYRAYYGRALAANEQTRRLAEAELRAALQLEPENAPFRVMLAELYFDLNFHHRAKSEVERALAVEPNSATGQALLRKLEKSRKVG
jgi:curved DNA-binding protein CbpA